MTKKKEVVAAPEKEKKWGSVGAPDSQQRKEFLASIRTRKRDTKQKREARAANIAKEDITLIESKTVDLNLQEDTVIAPPHKTKTVADVIVKEHKKIDAPGASGMPYVVYPY